MELYRHCALWHSGCGVARTKVLFRSESGKKAGYWMDREVYASIPIKEKATPDDFRKFGELQECENLEIYSNK